MTQIVNKFNDMTMNLKQFLCVIVFLLLGLVQGFSQDNIETMLKKNINPLASNLTEELTVSRDSLLLVNNLLFSKIRFFNQSQDFDKTFYFKPAVKRGKIALKDLPLGSYSVMFYQVDRIIVFRLDRLSKFKNTIKTAAPNDPAILATMDYVPRADNPNRPEDTTFNTTQNNSFTNMTAGTSDFSLNTNSENRTATGLSNTATTSFNMPSTEDGYDLASTGSSSNMITLLDTGLKPDPNGQNGKTFGSNSMLFETERQGMHPYDLSNQDRDHVQTREDYRSTHLRPNGKPYN